MSDIKYSAGAETEKLRPCEVSLYRKTFLARLAHGASVEGADKQGLHACKVWEKRGALNDDETGDADESARYADAIFALVEFVERITAENPLGPRAAACLSTILRGVLNGGDIATFKHRIESIVAPEVFGGKFESTDIAAAATKLANAAKKIDEATSKF